MEHDAQSRMQQLALVDSLTGLANRTQLRDKLQAKLETATRKPAALLCMNMDHFKRVNDMFGHAAGDVVLREVARRLRALPALGSAFLVAMTGYESDKDRALAACVDLLVQKPEERDRVEILPTPERVGVPLPCRTGVVEIQHRRDRVDAQPVGVEIKQPFEPAPDQEVAHLVPPVVENQRAPVGMDAAPGIVVLVERAAVEPGERELVVREVRGDPVEQHTDAVRVQDVDHLAELVG